MDFPTSGIVVNQDDLLSIYEKGVGKIKIRGKVEVEKGRNGKQYLVITEIPYPMIGANIGKFLNDVAGLVESKKAPEIVDISNQSSKEGTRIVLELKKARMWSGSRICCTRKHVWKIRSVSTCSPWQMEDRRR